MLVPRSSHNIISMTILYDFYSVLEKKTERFQQKLDFFLLRIY